MHVLMRGVAVGATVMAAGACNRPMPLLDQKVNAMSSSAIRASVDRLQFGECRTRPRTAHGTVPGQRTRLQICAVKGGEFAGGPSTPANGVWVARIVNKGVLPDRRWQLNPGDFESWIVVYGPAPVKYAIVEVSTTSPSGPPRVVVMDGVYHHCGHVHVPPRPPQARASFGTCQDHPAGPGDPPDSTSAGSAPALRRGLTLLRDVFLPKTVNAQGPGLLDGPGWIDCGGDCCTTDAS